MRNLIAFLVLSGAFTQLTACAHQTPEPELQATAPTPTPLKTKIKYVYVTPATESAMTLQPYERDEVPRLSFESRVVKFFWPLLTMMATGFLFILVLLGEHLILNKLLARRRDQRRELKGPLREPGKDEHVGPLTPA